MNKLSKLEQDFHLKEGSHFFTCRQRGWAATSKLCYTCTRRMLSSKYWRMWSLSTGTGYCLYHVVYAKSCRHTQVNLVSDLSIKLGKLWGRIYWLRLGQQFTWLEASHCLDRTCSESRWSLPTPAFSKDCVDKQGHVRESRLASFCLIGSHTWEGIQNPPFYLSFVTFSNFWGA